MLENKEKITAQELKAYLISLNDKSTGEKAKQVNIYKAKCKKDKRKLDKKEIQKIEKRIDEKYERRTQTKDEILNLLEECAEIPSKIEKLQIAEYMIYRVDIRRAENIIEKAIKNVEKRYNKIIYEIYDKLDDFSELDNLKEIDFSIFKRTEENLNKAKEQYKVEYTEDERRALIKKELDIIEKVKAFNTTPILHEILKNSDRELQLKMQKFNSVRLKRLRIISTMKLDYIKLEVPRELYCMIDDAMLNIEQNKDILTKSEYEKIKKCLIKRRKKIYRKTNEIRSIINAKEKKTDILNYNIQEARYERMDVLRNIITDSTNVIKTYRNPEAEEILKKLEANYQREKQFASVIQNLEDTKETDVNAEVKALEYQIKNLKQKMENSKKIISEQEEKIEKARKELLILWKIEIDSAISKKKEVLELPGATEEHSELVKEKNLGKKSVFNLKRISGGKHACV